MAIFSRPSDFAQHFRSPESQSNIIKKSNFNGQAIAHFCPCFLFVVYTTAPAAFDHIVFTTRKARKLSRSTRSLSKLMTPLTAQVWLCCFISILSLLVTMKCVLARPSVIGTEVGCGTATELEVVLMKPILGQAPNVSKKGANSHDVLVRLLLGTWLVCLIILVVGYTSIMTSQIVLPLYKCRQ